MLFPFVEASFFLMKIEASYVNVSSGYAATPRRRPVRMQLGISGIARWNGSPTRISSERRA